MHEELELLHHLEMTRFGLLEGVSASKFQRRGQCFVVNKAKRVTHLDLCHCQLTDIKMLSVMTALTHLYLSENQIEDIRVLENMPALRELYLDGNRIENIAPIASLPSLTRLVLSDNCITDLRPLLNLKALNRLELDGNSLNDVSHLNLVGLPSLTYLDISRCDLKVLPEALYKRFKNFDHEYEHDSLIVYENPWRVPARYVVKEGKASTEAWYKKHNLTKLKMPVEPPQILWSF